MDASTYSRIAEWSEEGADMSQFRRVFSEVRLGSAFDFEQPLDPNGYEWIPQGGRMPSAGYGVKVLAKELEDFILCGDSTVALAPAHAQQAPWKVP